MENLVLNKIDQFIMDKSKQKKQTVNKKNVKKAVSEVKTKRSPSFIELIVHAIKLLKESRGSTRSDILKCISDSHSKSPAEIKGYVNRALKKGVASGVLIKAKAGVNGKFKINKQSPANAVAKKPKKKAATAVTNKSKAKKPKQAKQSPKTAKAKSTKVKPNKDEEPKKTSKRVASKASKTEK